MHHFLLKLYGVYWTTFVKHSTVDFILKIFFNRTESLVDLCHRRMLKKISFNNMEEIRKGLWTQMKIQACKQEKDNFCWVINLIQNLNLLKSIALMFQLQSTSSKHTSQESSPRCVPIVFWLFCRLLFTTLHFFSIPCLFKKAVIITTMQWQFPYWCRN